MELPPTICAIRGAICVQEDVPELIETAAATLYREVLALNSLQEEEVAYLLITQTSDLKSRNPATGLRKAGYCGSTPLFCMQELEIDGMLEKVIRMLVVVNHPMEQTIPVFMQGAEVLRPEYAHPSM
ncbi:MAG: chorismate mutase [Sphaerochaetaceae bacterium]|nr:chorismate mutase [uncultured Sphaerochaeta sp.]MDC7228950.1 chorismate mutase [Sphaerochaetaceae bacterium]